MAKLLDCTLRDGGYYTDWDFSFALINQYLVAMKAAGVDVVEIGFRFWRNTGFKGVCAFSPDEFIRDLDVPEGLGIGVMVNAADLVIDGRLDYGRLEGLFPESAVTSPVSLIRIACHVHEFQAVLPATHWLTERGFAVGINLMQVADRTRDEVESLACAAASYPLDVLYFADSMGSMQPEDTARIVGWLRAHWQGPIGVHTHDNQGLALSNTLRALTEGATWIDSTVTGMGRGPGNARTEELAIEIAERRGEPTNMVPLMTLLREHFKPMQAHYGWGTNPYYYLAGKYGIHPTYIQEMLNDSRYSEEDILAVIEHLRVEGGKNFSLNTLDAARHFYYGDPKGQWSPKERFTGREVLLLGTGPGVARHLEALERYIRDHKPLVVALNTQSAVKAELIDLRVACHPVRLLADCQAHTRLPQPLIAPYSMLPANVRDSLGSKEVLDFGLKVQAERFAFADTHCIAPTSLVMAYAFAIAASGGASTLYLAGFDGYPGENPRNTEMNRVVQQFQEANDALPLIAITPSRYDVIKQSVYGIHL